jgi:hypothetical protein
MQEDCVRPEIAPDPAGKARPQQQAAGDGALVFEPTVEGEQLQVKVVKPQNSLR